MGFQLQSVSSNWKAISQKLKAGGDASDKSPPLPSETTKEGELWFDVDEQTLRRSQIEAQIAKGSSTKQTISILDLFPKQHNHHHHTGDTHQKDAGKYVAIDCEMVGVGPDGTRSALARVSIVNYHGEVLMDRYVKPVEAITDYRTAVSGIEPHHLVGAASLADVQQEVWNMIQGKILVGHSLKNDFQALLLEHPRKMTRDTSKYRPFRKIAMGKNPSLKRLAKHFLGIDIQSGSHDSVDDARVTMLLYRNHKIDWENYLFRQVGKVIKEQKRLKAKQQP